jgi:hypothetical protein
MTDSPQTTNSTSADTRIGPLLVALAGVFLLVLGSNYFFGQRDTEVAGTVDPRGRLASGDAGAGIRLEQQVGHPPPAIVVVHRHPTTVLDAMVRAAEADEAWHFAYDGTGASAFLTRLGEQTNQGGEGHNWQYEVNGQPAEVSFGVRVLVPGDRVLWKFAPSE